MLPVGVFPTALYEAIVCTGLFFVLWSLRKRVKLPIQLSAIYLILNGGERFLIEKIRVNFRYDWGALHPSQAEIISVCMMILGCLLFALAPRLNRNKVQLS
jgi:phosphatidylglycerol:prolipoprotein diacylglycerol transferase